MSLLILLLVSGCGKTTSGTDTFCILYEPVPPSRMDTIRSADHMAKFKELWERRCEEGDFTTVWHSDGFEKPSLQKAPNLSNLE